MRCLFQLSCTTINHVSWQLATKWLIKLHLFWLSLQKRTVRWKGQDIELTGNVDGCHENHWCTAKRPRNGATEHESAGRWHPWGDYCPNSTATQFGAIGGYTWRAGPRCLEWQDAVLPQHHWLLRWPGQHLALPVPLPTEWRRWVVSIAKMLIVLPQNSLRCHSVDERPKMCNCWQKKESVCQSMGALGNPMIANKYPGQFQLQSQFHSHRHLFAVDKANYFGCSCSILGAVIARSGAKILWHVAHALNLNLNLNLNRNAKSVS